MKVIFKLVLVLLVFSFCSCSSDDDSNDSMDDDPVTFQAAYELTALVVESSFDFNNDGMNYSYPEEDVVLEYNKE